MLDQVLHWLAPKPGQVFVDGTAGGGGHTAHLARLVSPDGAVLAVDLDPSTVDHLQTRLKGLPVQLVCGSYEEIPDFLQQIQVPAVDGILLDLGLSSDQLADEQRGFSYQSSGPLDMRFDPEQGEPASQLLNRIREQDLANIIYRYGEERFSRRIARKIVACRKDSPIRTAAELAELVRSCVPRSRGHQIDPATRTFQALRIAVNAELDTLEKALRLLPDCLKPGGRIAVISFHSLEDRIVKHHFRDDDRLAVLTKRPLAATATEVAQNPRARSAKLRIAEREDCKTPNQ